MKNTNFEARREALLKDIREVMDDVEELYRNGVEAVRKRAAKLEPNWKKNWPWPKSA